MRPALFAAFVLATTTAAAGAQPAPSIEPGQTLTPGEVAETDPAVVCQPGYSRRIREQMRRGLRASYYRLHGIGREDDRFVIDHRVPLSLGGADTARNMWPEQKNGPLDSRVKDGLEDLLHRRVCHEHAMTLRAAQDVFLGDWVTAWHAFGEPGPVNIAE